MLKDDMIGCIVGDEYIEDDEEKEERFKDLAMDSIEDADAEIDGYLSKRYKTPFTPVPKTLNKFAKDIAVYNLVSRQGIDESEREKTYLNRYNAAVNFLTKVASGLIDIGVGNNSVADTAREGFQVIHAGRLFTRENMEGW